MFYSDVYTHTINHHANSSRVKVKPYSTSRSGTEIDYTNIEQKNNVQRMGIRKEQ